MKKILTIGGATKDIFLSYKTAQMFYLSLYEGRRSFLIFEDGKKVETDELKIFTGGGAANAAVGFSRLGHSTASFFKIGQDQEGTYILNSLKSSGVDISPVVSTNQAPTATSYIIPTENGNRIALVYRGANLFLSESEIPVNVINESDILYITSLTGKSSDLLLPITRLGKEHNKLIACNPGTSQLKMGTHTLCESLKYIDILILNASEACQCMSSMVRADKELQIKLIEMQLPPINKKLPALLQGPLVYNGLCFSLHTYVQEILARGPKIVVVTNGKEGVYIGTDNRILFNPSLSVPVTSTLGAGDAFGSGFVGMYAYDYSLEDSIRAGMLNSASVIGHEGATTGLLSKNDMDNRLEAIVKVILQEYPLKEW